MAAYQTDDYYLPAGNNSSSTSVSVVVAPGTGSVQVQIEDPAGDYFTPADASYTLDVADVYYMPRQNRPATKIVAVGDAQFYVIGA